LEGSTLQNYKKLKYALLIKSVIKICNFAGNKENGQNFKNIMESRAYNAKMNYNINIKMNNKNQTLKYFLTNVYRQQRMRDFFVRVQRNYKIIMILLKYII